MFLALPSLVVAERYDDGSFVRIRVPVDGAQITGNDLDLEFDFQRGERADHVHVYVNGQYQKDFPRKMMGLARGPHEIKIVAATADHGLLKAFATVRFHIQ